MNKSEDKNLKMLRTKIAFKIKQKAIFITFKELSLKEMSKIFWKVRVRLKEA